MSTRTRQWGPCLAERIDSVTDKPAQSEEGWGKGQGGKRVGKGRGWGQPVLSGERIAKGDRKEERGKKCPGIKKNQYRERNQCEPSKN